MPLIDTYGHYETFAKRPLLPNFQPSLKLRPGKLRQTQILILKILNVFLRLKISSALNYTKIEHFAKVSACY